MFVCFAGEHTSVVVDVSRGRTETSAGGGDASGASRVGLAGL